MMDMVKRTNKIRKLVDKERKDSKDVTIHPSIDEKEAAKRSPFYFDMFTMRERPFNNQWIENLAIEMVNWANNEAHEALHIKQFYHKKGLLPRDINRFAERYPALKDAQDYAKSLIGVRREVGGLKKQYSESLVKDSMPMYDEEYMALLEHKAQLSKKEDNVDKGPQFIVIDQFPSSPLVPVKKDK